MFENLCYLPYAIFYTLLQYADLLLFTDIKYQNKQNNFHIICINHEVLKQKHKLTARGFQHETHDSFLHRIRRQYLLY